MRPAILRAEEKLVQHSITWNVFLTLSVGPIAVPSRLPETLTTAPLSATTLAWL